MRLSLSISTQELVLLLLHGVGLTAQTSVRTTASRTSIHSHIHQARAIPNLHSLRQRQNRAVEGQVVTICTSSRVNDSIRGLPLMACSLQHMALIIIGGELGADVRAHGLVRLPVALRAHAHAAARLLPAVLRRVGAVYAVTHISWARLSTVALACLQGVGADVQVQERLGSACTGPLSHTTGLRTLAPWSPVIVAAVSLVEVACINRLGVH